MQNCQNCARLSQENAALRRKIEELESKVFWLQQTIEAARVYALSVYNQARQVMSDHQPRGTWSLWKGKGEVAREIFNRLTTGGG